MKCRVGFILLHFFLIVSGISRLSGGWRATMGITENMDEVIVERFRAIRFVKANRVACSCCLSNCQVKVDADRLEMHVLEVVVRTMNPTTRLVSWAKGLVYATRVRGTEDDKYSSCVSHIASFPSRLPSVILCGQERGSLEKCRQSDPAVLDFTSFSTSSLNRHHGQSVEAVGGLCLVLSSPCTLPDPIPHH